MSEWTNTVHVGDCFDMLEQLPAESVHAVVTDPPYAEGDYNGFMGRDWDSFEGPRAFQEWNREWATDAKRVLKPGGHLLAFGSDDGHHRTACGIEDAGFEIRTHINWIYGSGFPKALDVSKSIDKQADAEREVVDKCENWGDSKHSQDGKTAYGDYEGEWSVTEPATDAAERWDGWKTGLKPATEFLVVARKPLSEGTVAENVQEWGTGALNVDGCRIESEERPDRRQTTHDTGERKKYGEYESNTSRADGTTTEDRYPANVVFDEQAAERLDGEVGELAGGAYTPENWTGRNTSDAPTHNDPDERIQIDNGGGPSRYFYTSKAHKSERTIDGEVENDHPTVKPVDLMQWLVRLVTREGQKVLDPFAGSGTTPIACEIENREWIALEKSPEHAELARNRIEAFRENPEVVCDAEEDDVSEVKRRMQGKTDKPDWW